MKIFRNMKIFQIHENISDSWKYFRRPADVVVAGVAAAVVAEELEEAGAVLSLPGPGGRSSSQTHQLRASPASPTESLR